MLQTDSFKTSEGDEMHENGKQYPEKSIPSIAEGVKVSAEEPPTNATCGHGNEHYQCHYDLEDLHFLIKQQSLLFLLLLGVSH